MPYYAQINAARIVTSISEITTAVDAPDMIELEAFDASRLGKRHNAETGLFEDVAPGPAPVPEWAWYIDHGPFTDRLGGMATMVIDTSSEPGFVGIRADFARRKWIDLKDPRVIATVRYLAGQPLPGLGTLAQPLLTAEQADAALNTPVALGENLALRKLYFS